MQRMPYILLSIWAHLGARVHMFPGFEDLASVALGRRGTPSPLRTALVHSACTGSFTQPVYHPEHLFVSLEPSEISWYARGYASGFIATWTAAMPPV